MPWRAGEAPPTRVTLGPAVDVLTDRMLVIPAGGLDGSLADR